MQAGNATVYAGSWRHPATEHGFLTAGYYEKLARTLEEGCFDLMFFDDRLAMPGHLRRVGGRGGAHRRPAGEARPEHRARHRGRGDRAGSGSAPPTRRPTTRRSTSPAPSPRSTTSRAAGPRGTWSRRSTTARRRTTALKEVLAHDARYDRADEFLEATTGLWDSWDDDALVLDRATPLFADPAKVHELDYDGEWFSVRGPLTVPRCPQGRPVLLQAGSSGRGRDFAARWAELIFTGDPGHRHRPLALQGPEGDASASAGRDPDSVKMLPDGLHGRRRVEGPRRGARAAVPQRPRRPHGVAHAAVRAHELRLLRPRARRPHHRRAHRVGVGHPWPRAEHQDPHRRRHGDAGRPGRAPGHPAAGPALRRAPGRTSPTRWRSGSTAAPATASSSRPPTRPGAYEDVVRLVVPELQRRGVFRDRYTGTTLREHLGLERPASPHGA